MIYNTIKQNNSPLKGNINRHKLLRKKQLNIMSTITFLIKCRNAGITPRFLNNLTEKVKIVFDDRSMSDRRISGALNTILDNFNRKILNLLIKTKHENLKYIKTEVEKQRILINDSLKTEEQENFWKSEEILSKKESKRIKDGHKKKYEKLSKEQRDELGIIWNEDWFINKTNVEIPKASQWLLSLGEKFALPTDKKGFPLFKMIADVEDCIHTLDDKEEQETARTKFTSILEDHINKRTLSRRERFIFQTFQQTKKFMKKNKNILILRADKGNVTVAMDKKDYDNKMNIIVNDMMTYRRIRKDPTSGLQARNNDLVEQLYSHKIISEIERKRLKNDVALAPRLYGLPKIHKKDCPLRPICSSINSPSIELCKFLTNILKKLTENSIFNVKDAVQFKNKISNSTIEEDEKMISFDVVSLFPSIPIDYAIKIMEKRWDDIERHTNIPRDLFLKILKFCISDNRYFKYKEKFYFQYKGLPMGSPASPIVADIVMEELLKSCMENIEEKPRLLTKYVDDLFGIVKISAIDTLLTKLNSFNRYIKFTMEEEDKGKLPYLDAVMIRNNGKIKMDWYQKKTSSGRLINFYSNHPKHIIINTAKNFIKRVFSISDTTFHLNNSQKIINILTKNCFPKKTIEKLIREFKLDNGKEEKQSEGEMTYKSVVYVPGFSERMINSNIFKRNKFKIVQTSSNTLRQLFTDTKSKLDVMEKHNVIYKINCLGDSANKCNMSYVGTTKNKLKTRIAGHRSDYKNRKNIVNQKTALATHCAEMSHTPDLEKVKILQRESKHNKRFMLEMLHIINTPREERMNYKTDVENCAHIYRNIINKKISN